VPDVTERLTGSPDGRTILVIDDHDGVRAGLRWLFESLGLRTLEASGGETGLEILRGAREVSAVVLDLEMPGLGGEQVLAVIRHRHRDLPVIIVSGAVEPDRAARLQAAGATACLNKADAMSGLEPIIRRLLSGAGATHRS
jgi:CheY-like chemotaxis protein